VHPEISVHALNMRHRGLGSKPGRWPGQHVVDISPAGCAGLGLIGAPGNVLSWHKEDGRISVSQAKLIYDQDSLCNCEVVHTWAVFLQARLIVDIQVEPSPALAANGMQSDRATKLQNAS
jgi:hypothetical protein